MDKTNEEAIEKWELDLGLNKTISKMGIGVDQTLDSEKTIRKPPCPFRTLLLRCPVK